MYPKRGPFGMWVKAGGWLAGILLVAGIGLGAAAVSGRTTADALKADGVTVAGAVDSKTRYQRNNKEDGYTVTYTFPVGSTSTVTADQDVSRDFFDDVSEGQVVEVRYLPANLEISEVEVGSGGRKSWVTMVMSAVLLAAGVTYGWFSAQRARVTVALRDYGEVRTAKVTEHRINQPDNSDKKPTSGVALWRDSAGAMGETLSRKPAELPEIGATLTVYADPKGGSKAVWEGDVGTR